MSETICSISTAPGMGAIAVIRVSGKKSFPIVNKVFRAKNPEIKITGALKNTFHLGKIIEGNETIDEVLVSIFKSPHSYTGEDTVEISCHGSKYIQQKILEILIRNGAQLAKPGEFTLRAYLSGKLDLSQAEGVADLIASSSEGAHRLAIEQMRGGFSKEIKALRDKLLHFISMIELELDFSEEDVEFANRDELKVLLEEINSKLLVLINSFEYGNAMKSGLPVVILGRTNAGKSTLLNLLLKEEKAIVSEIAGTTRDYIEDTIVIKGIEFRFIDTAGLRKTSDIIETIGISRAVDKAEQAKIILGIVDSTLPLSEQKITLGILEKSIMQNKKVIVLLNKIDLVDQKLLHLINNDLKKQLEGDYSVIPVSLKQNTNLNLLEENLDKIANDYSTYEKDIVVTNVRHYEALQHSQEAIARALINLEENLQSDLLAMDIREVLHYLGEITGEITTDEILGNIFNNFCIGK